MGPCWRRLDSQFAIASCDFSKGKLSSSSSSRCRPVTQLPPSYRPATAQLPSYRPVTANAHQRHPTRNAVDAGPAPAPHLMT